LVSSQDRKTREAAVPAADRIEPARSKVSIRGTHCRFTGKRGSEVHAFGPVDLEIGDGEFLCLIGPSGCGKSTLLRAIAGLVVPNAGDIEIAVEGTRPPIAMVFQDYGIYPWKTVEANVRFGLQLTGVSRQETKRRVDKWLEALRLQDFAKAYPHTLSGGMRQRVAIARALAVEPQILLMDEPFAALDAQLREVLQDELLALWQADRRTVVFVTHSLEEAIVLGDRVAVMSSRPGRIVDVVDVPFDRPRTGALRNQAEFGQLRGQLWQLLQSEIEPERTGER
jgi:NitT/TauT family transport system ATP-binding protein